MDTRVTINGCHGYLNIMAREQNLRNLKTEKVGITLLRELEPGFMVPTPEHGQIITATMSRSQQIHPVNQVSIFQGPAKSYIAAHLEGALCSVAWPLKDPM